MFIYSKKLSNIPLKQVEKKRATLCNLLRFPGWCFYVWPKDGYRLFESELVYSHPHTASCFASLAPWPRNRGTSERTHLNPSGQTRHKSVRDGNWICGRTLVLLYIAAALQTWWLLEQPVNSFMEHLPAFKCFMRQVTTYRHSICMRDYGGPTLKPTWLYSGNLISFMGSLSWNLFWV